MEQIIWNETVSTTKDTVLISLKKDSVTQLRKIGTMNSTYDSVIKELLEHIERCDSFWCDRL